MTPNRLRMVISGDGGWMAYGIATGFWKWIPMWFQHGVTGVWNPIVCLWKGHRLVGSMGEYECSHCMHCCKETVVPCQACDHFKMR